MSILQRIRERAAADPQHIVLPEGEDPRTVVAASIVARDRLARVTVLGDEEKVRASARAAGADLGGVAVLDHRRAPDFEQDRRALPRVAPLEGLDARRGAHRRTRPALLRQPARTRRQGRRLGGGRDEHDGAHRPRRAPLHRHQAGLPHRQQLLRDGSARPRVRRTAARSFTPTAASSSNRPRPSWPR